MLFYRRDARSGVSKILTLSGEILVGPFPTFFVSLQILNNPVSTYVIYNHNNL